MKKVQESVKKESRVMDSFIKKAWLFLIAALMVPALGSFAQTQDNMKNKNTKTDTTKSMKKDKTYDKSTHTDTSKTYRYNEQNQKMDQQNQNQNQQNRNRYDNQRGDTLQRDKDAVLIENEPRK